ncbi:MAG: YkgJ family cysteine cluster protein, partial [Nitrospiraceae bacterium]
DEQDRSWLTLLLDGYHIVDRGVAAAIEAERQKGRDVACARGCSQCCSTHKDIPLYPLEIIGISWYAVEKVTGVEREILRQQLKAFTKDSACPFLVGRACSIHPLRPMACRQFNVFGSPCKEGEDPFHTRRGDVMDPVKKHVDQAFYVMLPYYGVENEAERVRAVEAGAFHRMVRELHACRWRELAEKMERRDNSAETRKSGSADVRKRESAEVGKMKEGLWAGGDRRGAQ